MHRTVGPASTSKTPVLSRKWHSSNRTDLTAVRRVSLRVPKSDSRYRASTGPASDRCLQVISSLPAIASSSVQRSVCSRRLSHRVRGKPLTCPNLILLFGGFSSSVFWAAKDEGSTRPSRVCRSCTHSGYSAFPIQRILLHCGFWRSCRIDRKRCLRKS